MKGLTFYLGSSEPTQFLSINGYFYSPKLYVNYGSLLVTGEVAQLDLTISAAIFLNSAEELQAHYDSRKAAIVQEAAYGLAVSEDETDADTLCNNPSENSEPTYTSGDYPFA